VHISGGTSGQVLSTDGAGNLSWTTAGGGGGTPGGSNTQIQFNDGGSFGGSANLTYNKTTEVLTSNALSVGNLTANGTVNLSDSANITIGDLANLHITGGNTSTFIGTDGNGNLSWNSVPTTSSIAAIWSSEDSGGEAYVSTQSYYNSGGSIYTILSGIYSQDVGGFAHNYANYFTSINFGSISHVITESANIHYLVSDYIAIGDGGGRNTSLEMYSNGSVNFANSNSITLGSVANLHISGGNNSQYLKTDGAGNLSWSSLSLRVTSNTTIDNLEINCDTTDQFNITALAESITITLPTGTPTDGQKLMIRIRDDGTARAITWGVGESGAFRAVGPTLPTTTTPNKLMYVGSIWNAADSRWDVIALSEEA
jgi:hypothetical protein